MPIPPSVEKLHTIKGNLFVLLLLLLLFFLHFASERWIGAVNLFNVRCVSKPVITAIFI